MAQFSGSPVQFMTTDDIKYKRTDGWFLSYKKAAIFIPIFILVLIAAGFIGWYSHSIPKKRVQNVLTLLDEDTTKEQDTSSLVSSFVHPLKYWLYLKSTIIDYQLVTFEGRVVIEFRIDAPAHLNKLFLNAVNINVKQYELSLSKDLVKVSEESRQRRRAVEENDSNDPAINITTVIYETTEDYQLGNETKVSSNDTLFDRKEDWLLVHSIGKGEETIEIKEYAIDKIKKHHVIYPKKVLKSGIYFLMIDYEVLSDDIVATNLGDHVGKRMVGTLLKPSEAPRVFPLFDGIHQRAVFSLSVERPKEMRVLSNMPLRSTKDASANWVIDTFDDTPIISPYNLAFVIGDLAIVNQTTINPNNVTSTFWAGSQTITPPNEQLYLLNKVEPIILGLTNVLSLPYTLPKLDVVALPSNVITESGNLGLISIRKIMFSTIDRAALVRKREALKSLIGLLGEQWLGGRDCMKSMADTWILDGSLVYLQDQLINEIDPSLQLAHSFVADVQTIAMEDDGYSVSRMSEVKTNPFYMGWSKERDTRGACLIRMLHGVINNDTAFRIAYEKLLTRCQNGTANVAEFLNSVNVATKELPEELSLKEVMDRWITQSGYPLVTVTRDYENGSTIVKQKAFFYNKPPLEKDTLWHVPLTYIKHDGNWSYPIKTWLKPEEEKIIYNIDAINNEGNKTSWILFNVNKAGYYRVNYDETNWRLLATALDENHESFPPETRASLIDDVFALAAVGASRYETAFGFIKYMQMKERHYAPWSAFAHHVFKLNNLLYETSAFLDFQMFLQQFITPLYDQVSEHLVEGSPLTLLAIKLGCLSKYSKCLDSTKRSFVRLRKDPAYKSTLPKYIYETLYCTTARHGGLEEWNYLSQKAKHTSKIDEKYDLLSSYGCFQSLEILNSILYELLHDDTYNEAEVSVILKSFSINSVASRAAYKFIKNNWNDIFEKFSGSRLTMESFILTMLNSVTNESDLDDLHAFWQNNYESIKTVKRATALVETRANFASSFAKNYSDDIRDWLKTFNNNHGM